MVQYLLKKIKFSYFEIFLNDQPQSINEWIQYTKLQRNITNIGYNNLKTNNYWDQMIGRSQKIMGKKENFPKNTDKCTHI